MREYIKSLYVGEQLDDEMRVFNVIHTVCVVGMFIMSFFVPLFIEDARGAYLTLGVSLFFLLTMIEANRTRNTRSCVIFMSVVFNIVYMPAIFFMFGRFICAIPVYFLFGIIYSVLLLDVYDGLAIGNIEIIVYMGCLYYGFKHMPIEMEAVDEKEIIIRYAAILIAIVLAGACAGAAIRYRYLYYEKVRINSEQLKREAMDAYVAKDMFLINMSHEIRTPMNAIVGAVNLLLDKDYNEHITDSAYNILNSCNALLSITDELMDLSKSESGNVELYLSNYDLNEFLMEIINMMSVRLTESNLDFFVDINKNIPRYLCGDLGKLRQVFVNILNNAIKFTESGKIILRVDYRNIDENNIELIADVEDTGCGIPKEDIDKIFLRHRGVQENSSQESYGIGLSISDGIVKEMGGTISVQSEYKVGSTFTIKIPQKFTSDEIVARLDELEKFKILVFEKNETYSDYTRRILEALSLKFDIAKTKQDFERMLSVNKYSHVFISNDRYKDCEEFLNQRLNAENIVALLDISDNVSISKANATLSRPVNAISISMLLRNESNNYVRNINQRGDFVCPHVTFLVVDDNYTNLNVASALLKKYDAKVLTAVSGKDCLRILRENEVDMVFLDYMMPEMNGIDTLENIRKIPGSRYTAMPVIALTANVVSGAREMFLEAGFDEFLAKPIAIDKLERVIRKYLPKELIVHKNKVANEKN